MLVFFKRSDKDTDEATDEPREFKGIEFHKILFLLFPEQPDAVAFKHPCSLSLLLCLKRMNKYQFVQQAHWRWTMFHPNG